MTHGHEHDLFLERIVTGEIERSSAEAARLRRDCTRCAEELDELERTLAEVNGAGELQRSVLQEVRGRAVPREVEFVRRTLAASGAAGKPRAARRWPWLLAACAAALALTVFWPRPRPAPVLLGDGLELALPRADDGAQVFSWRFELPPAGHYELRVWALSPAGEEELLLEALELDSPTWRAPPDSIRPGSDYRWAVEAYGAGGELLDSEAARFSR